MGICWNFDCGWCIQQKTTEYSIQLPYWPIWVNYCRSMVSLGSLALFSIVIQCSQTISMCKNFLWRNRWYLRLQSIKLGREILCLQLNIIGSWICSLHLWLLCGMYPFELAFSTFELAFCTSMQDKSSVSISMGEPYFQCWWYFCNDCCFSCCNCRGLF
jgi:hypothetical protein